MRIRNKNRAVLFPTALALFLVLLSTTAWAALPRDARMERIDATHVALVWNGAAVKEEKYRTGLGETPDIKGIDPVRQVAAKEGRVEFVHAAGQRPYAVIMDSRGARTMVAERVLPLEGGVNFRDLGGYESKDGRTVGWGRLFRSGAMNQLTEADHDYLENLGIKTICDFRSNSEREQAPTQTQRISPQGKVISWDYEQIIDTAAFAQVLSAGGDLDTNLRQLMAGFYRQMPSMFAPRYREVFDALKEGDGLLFHCSAGKDRTGLMAALLLSALEVHVDVIMADYALTERVESLQRLHVQGASQEGKKADAAMAMFAKLPPVAAKALMASDPAFLSAAFDQIRVDYGSVDGYLEKELGMGQADRARLKEAYLVTNPNP